MQGGRREYNASRESLTVWIVGDNSASELPDARDTRDIAPSFDWGRINPGTMQLAFAMLTDAIGPLAAEQFYREFACDFLSGAPVEGWTIDLAVVVEWYHRRAVCGV